jgi:cytochrome P450
MFNPDRWDKQHQPIPGVWGNMMTFIAGPRNCIGHRLTILEMKIVLFTLLRGFAFEVPPSKPVLKRTCM